VAWLGADAAAATWAQTPPPATCEAWRVCRDHALEAESRGDFEAFHDLAWRTMQTRGRNDPGVMVLLARAQTLSGRPHDALVMLRRITELGVAPAEALTGAAFARTRALPGWPQVHELIVRAAASAEAVPPVSDPPVSPAPAATAAPANPISLPSPEAPPAPAGPAPEELFTIGRRNIVPGGLAYDSASGRVLVGNRRGRSVITISERLKTSMDLVRSASAGFREVLAIAIDARQGDLWVASAGNSAGAASSSGESRAALHKLQLVSGRPLTEIPIETGDEPARFTALAVARGGDVFVLDGAAGRLWELPAGKRTPALVTTLDVSQPSALALDRQGAHAYVAHEGGLSRLTLASGTLTPVAAPEGVGLASIESLSWHEGALIALQRMPDGSHRLSRLRLNRRGTAIAQVEDLDRAIPTCTGTSAATLSGDDVYYLAAQGEASSSDCTLVVRRLRLP
jgi:hypothetical protein